VSGSNASQFSWLRASILVTFRLFFQNLQTDAKAMRLVDHAIVEAVHDRAVVG
jgi:hypothetical protein